VIRAEVIRDFERLAALAPAWRDLLGKSSNDQVMMSPTWLLAWWHVFGREGGREMASVAFFERERLVGLFPLLARAVRVAPGVSVRRLEVIGTGEHEAHEVGTDYVAPLVARGYEGTVTEAIAATLVGGALGGWGELVLGPMNGDCPIAVLLADALRARGLRVSLEVEGASFYVPLPPTFDAYLEALPGTRRAMIRRSLRAFERWAGAPAELDVVRREADLDRAKSELVHLHRARWAAAGRHGAFASPRFRAFHDEVMPALFAEGALELLFLRAHGEAVAAAYNLVWRNRVSFYQSGRAPTLPSELSPGIVLHALGMQRAIAMGRLEYDFLPGLARYKVELSLASRPVLALHAERPSALQMARAAAALAIDEARAIRRGLSRQATVRP
jgi:CelD/BcsL family acetyltransferase involved in cellulose biosynthesis